MRAEAAIRARDDALTADEVGEAADALGDELGSRCDESGLHQISAEALSGGDMVDDAGNAQARDVAARRDRRRCCQAARCVLRVLPSGRTGAYSFGTFGSRAHVMTNRRQHRVDSAFMRNDAVDPNGIPRGGQRRSAPIA